jgi:hypothetical protein
VKNNPFLSKEVKLKRVLKGFAIGLPVAIMIFVLGNYYINLIDDSLRDKYQTEKIVYVDKENVLGEEIALQEEFPDKFAEMTKNYGIDEYINNWDGKVEGYREQEGHISSPEYFISEQNSIVSDQWELKGGYELSLECPERGGIVTGNAYSCSLEYKNKLISDTVRHDIYSWLEKESIPSYVRFIVYSLDSTQTLKDIELLVIGEYSGGSFDTVSVYRLEDGKATLISFYYKEEYRDTWLVESPIDVSLFYNTEGNVKLVTGYHEPSMGIRSVSRVWNLGEDFLSLDRTIGNVIEDDK